MQYCARCEDQGAMHGWMHALMPWFIDMPQLAICEEGTWAHATNFKQYENPLDTEETKSKHCQQTLTAKIESLLFESLNMFPCFGMILQYIAVYYTFFQLIPVPWMTFSLWHSRLRRLRRLWWLSLWLSLRRLLRVHALYARDAVHANQHARSTWLQMVGNETRFSRDGVDEYLWIGTVSLGALLKPPAFQ